MIQLSTYFILSTVQIFQGNYRAWPQGMWLYELILISDNHYILIPRGQALYLVIWVFQSIWVFDVW